MATRLASVRSTRSPTIRTSSSTARSNGEASLAIKESQGGLLTSLVGYSLNYSTIDNFKNPHNGWLASLNQDVAGLGGGTRYLRTTGDIRYFREIPYLDDVVGIARLQGGDLSTFGGYKPRIQDNFNLGPSLVRGFAPGGIGPARLEHSDELQQQPRQLARRLQLCRRIARSSVPVLGPAQGSGLERRALRRRRFAMEFQR